MSPHALLEADVRPQERLALLLLKKATHLAKQRLHGCRIAGFSGLQLQLRADLYAGSCDLARELKGLLDGQPQLLAEALDEVVRAIGEA